MLYIEYTLVLSCPLVWGRCMVLHHRYKTVAERADNGYRDGTIMLLESLCMLLDL